jgi:peptidyl-prolyl cis-trans isomerase A (cyclophilin A)
VATLSEGAALAMTPGRTTLSLVLLCGLVLVTGPSSSLAASKSQAEDKHPVVVLDTSFGPITLELDAEKAPISVENFLKYVDSGFYDNLIFHRVIPKFMIQGGGMDATMNEKEQGKRPPIKNESPNGLSNKTGTIAMARTQDLDSATCQFYINLKDNDFLDENRYAVFGKVIDGMDVVNKIAAVDTGNRPPHKNVPVNPVIIKSAKRKPKG